MDQKNLQFSESSSDSSNYQNAQRLTDDEFDNFSNHEDQHSIGTSEDVPIIDTQPTIGIRDSQNEEQIESEVFVDEDIPLATKFRRSDKQTIEISVSQTQELYIPPAKKFRRSQLIIDLDYSQSEELYDSPAGPSSSVDEEGPFSEDLFKGSEVAAKMDEPGTSGTSGLGHKSEDLFKCSEVSQIVSPKMDEPGTSGLSSEEIKLSNIAFLDEISEKCLKMVEDETDEDIEEMYAIACSRYLDKFLLKKHPDDIQKREKLLAKIKKAGEEGILS